MGIKLGNPAPLGLLAFGMTTMVRRLSRDGCICLIIDPNSRSNTKKSVDAFLHSDAHVRRHGEWFLLAIVSPVGYPPRLHPHSHHLLSSPTNSFGRRAGWKQSLRRWWRATPCFMAACASFLWPSLSSLKELRFPLPSLVATALFGWDGP